MDAIPRFSRRLLSLSIAEKGFRKTSNLQIWGASFAPSCVREFALRTGSVCLNPITTVPSWTIKRTHNSSYPIQRARAGWFLGLGDKKQSLPDIVKAGDPVLHEEAREVNPDEIGSERIQKIIDDMIDVMRKAPGVGLAAPQIGIPLKIIVLEDTKEYISYAPKEETRAQDRRPFDLLVLVNPKLKNKSNKTALFFEGCLSVDGYRAAVERNLEVEVTGLDRHGKPTKVDASGWQARIFQHECDHLNGTLYVDKMVPRTFRTVENVDLPLATGCPKLGAR